MTLIKKNLQKLFSEWVHRIKNHFAIKSNLKLPIFETFFTRQRVKIQISTMSIP